MNRPDRAPGSDDVSTRVPTDDSHPYGTNTDADVTSRMTGTAEPQHARGDTTGDTVAEAGDSGVVTDTSRPAERYEERQRVLPAKTSAAAAFGLVFGVLALFSALTAILAPLAVLFGLLGLLLGVIGVRMSRRRGITGKGVAAGGIVTALLGLLLGAGVLVGLNLYVNDEARLDQLQNWLDDARDNLPSGEDVVESIPGQ